MFAVIELASVTIYSSWSPAVIGIEFAPVHTKRISWGANVDVSLGVITWKAGKGALVLESQPACS